RSRRGTHLGEARACCHRRGRSARARRARGALVAAEMTPGDLSRVAKKRAAEAAELSPRERHELVRKRRYVSITDRDDGMSDLRIYGPSLELRAVYDRATKLAKVVKQDRTRVRDQYRRRVRQPAAARCGGEACERRRGD